MLFWQTDYSAVFKHRSTRSPISVYCGNA